MMTSLIPELSVSDWRRSRAFYCDLLGFQARHDRPEEGFSYLCPGDACLMIDQIDLGRTFDDGHAPRTHPFGKGVNLQITVPDVMPLWQAVTQAGLPLFLPLEDRWYRRNETEVGNRQFIMADPDGYLLRLAQDLGTRPIPG